MPAEVAANAPALEDFFSPGNISAGRYRPRCTLRTFVLVEIKNFCAKVLKFFMQNFCAKVLNLMHLHFMIISEGAKPPLKSSWHADALD